MTEQATTIAKKWLDDADAILVTASNGLSISEGLNLFANDAKLREVLGDLVDKYHFPNLLAALSYNYSDKLDYWRAVARVFNAYVYNYQPSKYMDAIHQLIADRPYFIWTSNVDHHFDIAGFKNLFEIEGNWATGICSNDPANHPQVNLRDQLHELYLKDKNRTLTEADLPRCQVCDAPLELNVPGPNFQINKQQVNNFSNFIQQYENKKLLVLELGIGPQNQMIKAPSMQLIAANPTSHYITINKGQVYIPDNIADRSIGYSSSIDEAFTELLTGKSQGAQTVGPTEKKQQPQLSPEQQKEQEKITQQFYPYYMVDHGFRPGTYPLYFTLDQQHPSMLHTTRTGRAFMYQLGDSALVHIFSQNGHYSKVKLGLNKEEQELHGFYVNAGDLVAIESLHNNGAGFTQLSTEISAQDNGEILLPKVPELIKRFPQFEALIKRLSVSE